MPYASPQDLPKEIRGVLPPEAQAVWLEVFNATLERHPDDEPRAIATAWAAVGRGWEKPDDGGVWVKKQKTFIPPADVAANAADALSVRGKKPRSQQGMTLTGLARANQLASRRPVSLDTIRRMAAYFDRHEGDKKGETWGEKGKGWQAWMGWGGDEGRAWARQILREEAVKHACTQTPIHALRDKMEWKQTIEICKRDDDQRLAFGWLYVSRRADGSQVVDHSGETISPDTLEKAAYRFVLDARTGGLMHRRDESGNVLPVARLVECVAFTPEKRKAMGLPEGSLPDGMWVGFKVDDEEAWQGIKAGKFKMLSLGGKALRREVAE